MFSIFVHILENPTKISTRNPTRSSTMTPTKSPTKNPPRSATKSPTRNPTSNSFRNPTRQPIRIPKKILRGIRRGIQREVQRNVQKWSRLNFLKNLSQGFILGETNITMNQLMCCNSGLPNYEALSHFFQKNQTALLMKDEKKQKSESG